MSNWKTYLEELITESKKFPEEKYTLTKLAGEASSREYYRLQFSEGAHYILMKLPKGAASIAEEITKSTKASNEIPFVNIQKYLFGLELPVPKIEAFFEDAGMMILEDLGDHTLEKSLEQKSSEILLFMYKESIQLLHRLQTTTAAHKDEECIAFNRSFDADLLMWEFNHFLEYGIEDRLKIKVDPADKKIFEESTADIVSQIVKMPFGFTHRDYQSRNLMLHNYNFWMIDFQDALQGPQLYDLVALLRDSYISLDDEFLQMLLHVYQDLMPEDHLYKNFKQLQLDFDLITIQRKLKDAGRFQYIHTVKNNESFLPYVPLSLSYAAQALGRHKKYKALNKMIQKYLKDNFA